MGRGLNESVQGVAGRLHTFLCVRKITFFLRVLSMYLTFTALHIPVFRAFLHFFVTVGDGRFWHGEQNQQK